MFSPRRHRRAWATRVPLLREALGGQPGKPAKTISHRKLGKSLRDVIDLGDRSHVWLAFAVLTGHLPDETTVIELTRACEFDGGRSLWRAVAERTTHESSGHDVRVALREVLVDVGNTVGTDRVTGIQRVVRETARRWVAQHVCTPVGWTDASHSMRELSDVERRRLEGATNEEVESSPKGTVVVPWDCSIVLAEIGDMRSAPKRHAASLGNRLSAIGYDLIPITTAETAGTDASTWFAPYLSAMKNAKVVAPISEAAAAEFSGWCQALSATGLPGPKIRAVSLPSETLTPDEETMKAAHVRFRVGPMPMVLVVGTHEPRKNHLAVVQAAEILWREGLQFSISFVGNTGWHGESFVARVNQLRRAGRPIDIETSLTDDFLWAAYHLARFSVFPSMNEGFGLPLAESLSAGTPVITSNFGSMLELAADGGALTVDPHNDHAIADAMRTLLLDDALHARLSAEASARPARSWDDYANELWDVLVDILPESPATLDRE